jgi:hypothetical protein
MHENPLSIVEMRAKIAALPQERRALLTDKDEGTQEAPRPNAPTGRTVSVDIAKEPAHTTEA